MSRYNRIILTIVASIGISFFLMWVVQTEQSYKGQNLEASADPLGRQLTEQNLVDYMVKLPLKLQIAKVSWQHAILSIDLLSVPGNTIDTMVYHDLYEISQLGLYRLSNVNQVLVRIIEHKESLDNQNELLLAMDSRKENVAYQKKLPKQTNAVNMEKYLQNHYRLTYTQKWKEQFID